MHLSKNILSLLLSFALALRLRSPLALALAAAALLALTAAPGCVSQATCPPPAVEVTFLPPAGGGDDLISQGVEQISLYIFDSTTGILVAIVEIDARALTTGHINIPGLPDGTYTFVAWGGGSNMGGSYSGVQLDGNSPGTHSGIVVGTTTLSDFRLMLNVEQLPDGIEGDVTPVSDAFDDLFFAIATGITIPRNSGEPVSFNFINNTSTLRFTVTGLENLSTITHSRSTTGAPLDVFVLGKNGSYRYDNTVDETAPTVRYEASNMTFTDSFMGFDIKVLRLDIERHSTDPVLLYIRDAATGRDVVSPVDIVGAIRQILDQDGKPVYSTQDDIDGEQEFRIAVAIHPGGPGGVRITTTISINDWVIEVLIPQTEVN